jgi:4-hydroxy-2-oxoheptanedioate aldolase
MNAFKQLLLAQTTHQKPLFGCWLSSGAEVNAEIIAGLGFDWLCVDMEHGAIDVPQLRGLFNAIYAHGAVTQSPPPAIITRVPWNDMTTIKRVLDAGAETLLVPMLQSAAEAAAAVSYCRYPPRGVRGVAGGSKASQYGKVADYLHTAHERVCLIGQIENRAGLDACEAIAATEGMDALFVGPADLSASLGYLGEPSHPEVLSSIDRVVAATGAHNKACGVFSFNPSDAAMFAKRGVKFMALGGDAGALIAGARGLLAAANAS